MESNSTGIYPEMTVRELLDKYPKSVSVLRKQFIGYVYPGGFGCSDCPLAGEETLVQLADAHGVILDNLLKELTGVLGPGNNVKTCNS